MKAIALFVQNLGTESQDKMTDFQILNNQCHPEDSGLQPPTIYSDLVRFLACDVIRDLNKIEYALITNVHLHYKAWHEVPEPTASALLELASKFGFWDRPLNQARSAI